MVNDQVVEIIFIVLSLNKHLINEFSLTTPLLGAIPEFDSMAVVSILTALEDRFGFVVEDDEIDASIFETVGTLVEFVESKL